jgi:hypothetical protein
MKQYGVVLVFKGGLSKAKIQTALKALDEVLEPGYALIPPSLVTVGPMKQFYERDNVGTSKYTVNHHDGIKTHADGSPFYDIRIFSNRAKKDRFIRALSKDGYREGRGSLS